jgi:hypothetical protein
VGCIPRLSVHNKAQLKPPCSSCGQLGDRTGIAAVLQNGGLHNRRPGALVGASAKPSRKAL